MLNYKNLLERILLGEEVKDKICICPGGMMNMVTTELLEITNNSFVLAHTKGEVMANVAIESYKNSCFNNYGAPYCMTVEAEALGATVDLGSNLMEPRVIEYPIKSLDEIYKLDFNEKKSRIPVVLEAIRLLKNDRIPVIGNIVGPFSVATSLIEPMIFFREMIKNPEKCHRLLNYVTEILIDFGKKQIKAGADYITIAEPSGTGEILGPENFKKFVIPYLNRIIRSLKSLNKKEVIVHICGRLKSVTRQLNSLETAIISFDSITSIKDMKKELKDKYLMGNISTQILQNGSKKKIMQSTKYCIDNKIDILSPACGLGLKTSISNLKSVEEAIELYYKGDL